MSVINKIVEKYSEILSQNDIHNSKNEVEILVGHFMNITKTEIYLKPNETMVNSILKLLDDAIAERITRKPLQYIIGNVPFLNTNIEVNENVLIPRPETEFMVDLVINQSGLTNQKINILDLCTGSGAIAIALKKNIPQTTVYGYDICEKALQVAKKNAKMNNVEINFVKSDLFRIPNSEFRIKFDLIISNPPYIPPDVYYTLQPEIRFEPQIAFISENNGMFFYEKIISEARDYMRQDGTLYLEIGENQIKYILSLAKKCEYKKIDVYKDLCEKNRIVRLKI